MVVAIDAIPTGQTLYYNDVLGARVLTSSAFGISCNKGYGRANDNREFRVAMMTGSEAAARLAAARGPRHGGCQLSQTRALGVSMSHRLLSHTNS